MSLNDIPIPALAPNAPLGNDEGNDILQINLDASDENMSLAGETPEELRGSFVNTNLFCYV